MTKQSRGTRRLSSRETDVFGAARRPRYVPRIIEKVEAAGFKLQAKSEVNVNPKDTKDYPDGVWTLPPTFRLGEKDKEKYAAIGESDRMTLRFVKKSAK